MDKEICGIINIYKEKGFTSHDVVNVVRKALNRVKTGHTGTLDPDAEGVLPICVGKATKLAAYLTAEKKQYRAVIRLGLETTTQDTSGEVLRQCEVGCTAAEVEQAIKSFIGRYEQLPPMYSAIKVNGKKLYEYAREGKEIERKTRLIEIYAISAIKQLSNTDYSFTVDCSKGTYIRALCGDIGKRLGCGGCMADLVRTRSGDFYIENSVRLDRLKELAAEGRIDEVLLPPDEVLKVYRHLRAEKRAEKYVLNGNPLNKALVENANLAQLGEKVVIVFEGKTVGVYETGERELKPVTMLI